MMDSMALTGARIFDGEVWHENAALLLAGEVVTGIMSADEIPAGHEIVRLNGGILAPGFIDLQANGGGGVLFNEKPDIDGIRTICNAHACYGTTALLTTLITDTPEVMKRAIDAGIEAHRRKLPGFIGLHLEGPHLAVEKKGAHSLDLIRPMTDRDVETISEARKLLPNLMVTLAPEAAGDDHITALAAAGVCVSIGHSNVTAERAKQAFAAGARCVTHLFNAMSGLTHREPGLVGALLNTEDVFAGLIADGHHVATDAINVALRSKIGCGKIFLVTDAMSTIGTVLTEIELNGRRILRHNGKLTLEDGTLAGADLDMGSALKFIAANSTLPFGEALRMASFYPAQCLGIERNRGCLTKGAMADVVYFDIDKNAEAVWRNGIAVAV